jgi:hypothetical protein
VRLAYDGFKRISGKATRAQIRARRHPVGAPRSLFAESLGGHGPIMRPKSLLVVPALVACAQADHADLVRGQVVDAVSGRPVAMAECSILDHDRATWAAGATSDAHGRFRIPLSQPGTIRIVLRHYLYRPDTVIVPDSAWHAGEVRLAIRPKVPPCCEMRGRWHLTMWLDSARGAAPLTSESRGPAVGEIEFGPRHRDVAPVVTRYEAPTSPYEPGRFRLNWRALYPFAPADTPRERDSLRAEMGRSRFEDWRRSHDGAIAVSLGGDSILVGLGISSAGTVLFGRIRDDSVFGLWATDFYRGHFIMARSSARGPWPSN